jgi:hypothetical protein
MMTHKIFTPENCDPRNIWRDGKGCFWCIRGVTPGIPKMKDSHLANTIDYLVRAAKKQARYYNNMSDNESYMLAALAGSQLNGEMAEAMMNDLASSYIMTEESSYFAANDMGEPEVSWEECLHPKYRYLIDERERRMILAALEDEDHRDDYNDNCYYEYWMG